MTPPMPPAVEATPVASPRRTLNQCPTAAMQGVKINEEPVPRMTPNTTRNIQRSVQKLNNTIPPTVQTVPATISHLGPYLSKTGPMYTPPKKVRKVYTLNTHPTVPSLYEESWFSRV